MTVPVLFLAIVELAENDSVSPFGRDSEKLPSPVATPNFLSSPRHRHWLPVRLGCAGSSFLFGRTVTALGAAFGADNAAAEIRHVSFSRIAPDLYQPGMAASVIQT
jgi:hypothetical protein